MILHGMVRAGALMGVALALTLPLAASQGKGRPKISLRATPNVAFAPARMVVTAEFTDGADDFQEYYCAKVSWEWGDGTESSAQDDCDPYEAGKSQIRRRYSNEHKFIDPGVYDVRFRLKQGDKVVVASTLTLRIRDGAPAPIR